jgi:hypothetical protein
VSIVRGVLTDPTTAQPIGRRQVRVELVSGPAGAFLADGVHVIATTTAHSDAAGAWSVDVPPNDSYNPAGTYYRVHVGLPDPLAFVVPAGIAPVGGYTLDALLVDDPASPGAVSVGVSSGQLSAAVSGAQTAAAVDATSKANAAQSAAISAAAADATSKANAAAVTAESFTTAQLRGYVPGLATPPDHTVTPVYADTSTVPPVVKGWNGTAWVAIGGGGGTSLTDNGDGTWTATSGVTDNGDGTWTA